MPYHSGNGSRNGGNGSNGGMTRRRMNTRSRNQNDMNRNTNRSNRPVARNRTSNGQCPPGTHYMPPRNGNPGYCMEGETHQNGMNENRMNGNGMNGNGMRNGMNGNGMRNGMNGNGMNGNGMNGNGPGPSTAVHPSQRIRKAPQPVIKEPVPPKPTAPGGGSVPHVHSNFVLGSTGEPYTGPVINMGGIFYTVPNGHTKSDDSEQLVRVGHDNVGPVRHPNASKKNPGSF